MREGLLQPRAWSEGDVSVEYCLQREAGELAGVTRARQAKALSACTTHWLSCRDPLSCMLKTYVLSGTCMDFMISWQAQHASEVLRIRSESARTLEETTYTLEARVRSSNYD